MRHGKAIVCIFLLCLGLSWSQSLEKCTDDIEEVEECTDTEYHSYVECMRRRTKRSLDCNRSCDDCGSTDECSECDCNYCSYNDCSSSCNSCCESSPPPCRTRNCCHQTCNTQCKTISCRRRCRSKCQSKMSSTSAQISTNTHSNVSSALKSEAKHNITTVINLHNVINNTNIIDMPIMLNNTNINNITIEAPEPSEGSKSTVHIIDREKETVKESEKEEQKKDNCCKIVGPRQCMQTKVFPFMKCFHYRRQHCGELCRTSIMHAEPHEVCDQGSSGSESCHQQIAYIPQPQPRCTYTSTWPYVSCNIMNANCDGCYKHVVQGGQPNPSCSSSCYGQDFNVGPLYRQGPFFQGGMPQYAGCPSGNCEGAPFPAMGQQQYYHYENPMENMMQIEPSPQPVYQSGVQHT